MKTSTRKLADFTGKSLYAGIDVHKRSWKVTICTDHTELKTFSMDPNPDQLADYLENHYPGGTYHSVYEAGYFGFWACRQLQTRGIRCIVVNPADIPTRAKEKDKKNDKVDSRKLARELKSQGLEGIYIPRLEQEADRDLVRRRETLICQRSQIKNRIKAFLCRYNKTYQGEETGSWSRAHLAWLASLDLDQRSANQTLQFLLKDLQHASARVTEHNKVLRELSREVRFAEDVKLLKSIPSIGPITAMVLLTELGDMRRFGRLDSLCCFVGLVPSTHSTGDKKGDGPMTRRGNAHVKAVLIECAWIARRHDPALALRYEELIKGMTSQEAIIKIAKKLLSRIRHVLLTREPYDTGVVQ